MGIFFNDPIVTLLGDWAGELTVCSILLRLSMATAFAAVIGCERASKRHSAGLRTFILVSLASAMQGWLIIDANRAERVIALAAGLSLLYPGTITDIAGLAALALVATSQLARRRRLPPRNPGECIPSRI